MAGASDAAASSPLPLHRREYPGCSPFVASQRQPEGAVHNPGNATLSPPHLPGDRRCDNADYRRSGLPWVLTLRASCCADRYADRAASGDRVSRGSGQPTRVVWTPHLLGTVHAALLLAGQLAEQHTGYQELWEIGLRLVGLAGAVPVETRLDPDLFSYDSYDEDVYQQATTATTADLADQPEATVTHLLSRLVRGLRVDRWYLPYTAERLRHTRG